MRMKHSGGEECVMEIRGAGKGFTSFAHLMTNHRNTRRLLADTVSYLGSGL